MQRHPIHPRYAGVITADMEAAAGISEGNMDALHHLVTMARTEGDLTYIRRKAEELGASREQIAELTAGGVALTGSGC